MFNMRRQKQCEISSDEEYYTADEEITDIDQRLSLVYPNHIQFIFHYGLRIFSNLIAQSCITSILLGAKLIIKNCYIILFSEKILSEIGISRIQVRIVDGKRGWQ